MLFSLGHGQTVFKSVDEPVTGIEKSPAGRNALEALAEPNASNPALGNFRYYFPDASDLPGNCNAVAKLDALADAMIEDAGSPSSGDSGIPPVFTYFGQFIDHDITATTDTGSGVSDIATGNIAPVGRSIVESKIKNLRAGSLGLDSLYGDGPGGGTFARKLSTLLRHPKDRAKMWIALFSESSFGSVPMPQDKAGDLLRLGRLLDPTDPKLTEEELLALPRPLKTVFLNDDGSPKRHKAIIGDNRNDENLFVAQLHLAFLRLHNRIVDSCNNPTVLASGDDAVYEWAKQQVTWIYQWIVVNEFLPTICDPRILKQVVARESPLYSDFLRQHGSSNSQQLTIPLEFSVAAYRYGHSMVREEYDWNRFFGRSVGANGNLLDRANFRLMFAFTGNAQTPMPKPDGGSFDRLPSHWGAEWDRLIDKTSSHADRFARLVDPKLSLPLHDMINESTDHGGIFRMLAKRNLRRGHRLNIPSAQDCIAGVYLKTDLALDPLTDTELRSGSTGKAVADGGFDAATPLWFYVLKEAEIKSGGLGLGPLGSCLVADTLLGLVIADKGSYWHQAGSDKGRWHPADGAKPLGDPIENFDALLRAALLL
jgi:hypothetical protein